MFTHQGELKVERKSKYYVFKISNFRDYFTNLRQMHSSAVIYDIPDKKTGKSKKTCHRSWYKLNEDRRTSRVRLINAIQHAIREYQIAEEKIQQSQYRPSCSWLELSNIQLEYMHNHPHAPYKIV